MATHKSYNESLFNQFKAYFEDQIEDINPSLQKSTIISLEKYQEMVLGKNDTELTALDKKLDKTLSNNYRRRSSKFISTHDKQLQDSLMKIGVLSEEKEDILIIRKMPVVTQEQFDKIEKEYTFRDNNNILKNLYDYLNTVNCNYRNPLCHNSVGGINPLTYFIEVAFHMSNRNKKDMKEKYNILEKYMINYREINTDGNCFYRAVMFRYIEILILTENIPIFQRFIYDIIESFNSEEIKKRRIIGNNDVKPDLTFQILLLILNILKQKKIKEAHQFFVKCISTCKKFDYCLILYFRYVLYKYIKQNENKLYSKNFPLKIGNLLPQQFENEKGEFLYDSFYENYLLKFFTDAEKIIIYLTPYVLGIELNVIVYDMVEEIMQKFVWEGESDIKSKDVITLLNKKNHYVIVYNDYDNKTYNNIFEFYMSNIKSVILNKSLAPISTNYESDDKISLIEPINKENNNKNDINNIQKKENENKKPEINMNKIENKNEKNINEIPDNKINNEIKNNNDKDKNNINRNISNNTNNINPNQNIRQNDKINPNPNNNNKGIDLPKLERKNNLNIKDTNYFGVGGEKKNKKINFNKDNNEISNINNIKNNIDNNEIQDYPEKKNQKINIDNNLNNPKEIKPSTQIKINKMNAEPDDVQINEKKKKTKTEINKINNAETPTQDENARIINIKKTTNKKNKEKKSNKNILCEICKSNPRPNEDFPCCKNCFKNELSKQYYDLIQDNKDPIQNIYFRLKNKNYNLENVIKLFNASFKDSKLDYQILLENIKNNKCMLCTLKNTISLPCGCNNCKYCQHIGIYFKECELNSSFICPNKIKYNRNQMFKLGIILHKLEGWNSEVKCIIKYFDGRLEKYCCHCGQNLNEAKFAIKVYDSNKEGDANKFLSKINHYFCKECIKKVSKEFKCQICHMGHSLKME